jgi:hypothetical protein
VAIDLGEKGQCLLKQRFYSMQNSSNNNNNNNKDKIVYVLN